MPPYISIGGYSDPPRVPHFSLEVDRGELVVVTGGPGSGKTNLIKSLAGIRSTVRGSMRILGARPGDARARSDSLFVFQSGNFLEHVQVRQQLERKIALYRGASPREVRPVLKEWATETELVRLLDRTPGQLNRSQLQMLSFALLALTDAVVIVLDEPLEDLTSEQVSTAVAHIVDNLEGAAVLATARRRSPLLTKADRVVELS